MIQNDTVELRWVFSVIRRWWWVIVFCALLGAAGAFLISWRMSPVYEASTTLLIQQASGAGMSEYSAILASERLGSTYIQMMDDWPVMEIVIQRLELEETLQTLEKMVTAEVIPDTQLVMLKVKHTDPALAALIANSIAEVFIEQIQAMQEQRYAAFLSEMQEQIAGSLVLIEETQAEINALGTQGAAQDDPRLARLETNLAVYRSTYATLQQNYEQTRLSVIQSTPHVTVVEEARPPIIPIQPRVELYTVLAVTVAVMVAFGIVFLLEYLDDTIKTPGDVTEALGLSTLGVISQLKKGEQELVMITQPQSPAAEDYRLLRANIRYLSKEKPLRTLLVTSPGNNEGKSITVANLAFAMAEAGLNVVAVEANIHRPQLYRLFGRRPLRDRWSIVPLEGNTNGQLHLYHLRGLVNPTSGALQSGSTGMLGSKRIQELLGALVKGADVVLLDTPAVLSVADTIELAQVVEGVLLLLRSGRTRRQAAKRALENLRQAGTNPLGVVLSAVPPTSDSYYYAQDSSGNENWRWKRRLPKMEKAMETVRRLVESVRGAFSV